MCVVCIKCIDVLYSYCRMYSVAFKTCNEIWLMSNCDFDTRWRERHESGGDKELIYLLVMHDFFVLARHE